jgi:hypothetical protein
MNWSELRIVNDATQLGLPRPTKLQRSLTSLLILLSIVSGACLAFNEVMAFTEGRSVQPVHAIMAFALIYFIPRALKHGRRRTSRRSRS